MTSLKSWCVFNAVSLVSKNKNNSYKNKNKNKNSNEHLDSTHRSTSRAPFFRLSYILSPSIFKTLAGTRFCTSIVFLCVCMCVCVCVCVCFDFFFFELSHCCAFLFWMYSIRSTKKNKKHKNNDNKNNKQEINRDSRGVGTQDVDNRSAAAWARQAVLLKTQPSTTEPK